MTSTSGKPDHAFILAAGMGKRLRPHTDTLPKPLIPVNGKAIIDYTLDQLARSNIAEVTINLHYMADKMQDHLFRRASPRLTFSWEQDLLDTGGGIKKALYTMGPKPFFVFSGDTLWEDGPSGNTLERMGASWDDSMDLLLLLQPIDKMSLTHGTGDYDIIDGKPVRNRNRTGAYFWPSVRICHPRLFNDTPDTPFSFLDVMDRAEAAGKLGALVHDGICHHITAPDDLDRINLHYAKQGGPLQGGPKVA